MGLDLGNFMGFGGEDEEIVVVVLEGMERQERKIDDPFRKSNEVAHFWQMGPMANYPGY